MNNGNGSAWTEIAELNQVRRLGRCGHQGSVSAALVFTGSTPGPGGLGVNNTELLGMVVLGLNLA